MCFFFFTLLSLFLIKEYSRSPRYFLKIFSNSKLRLNWLSSICNMFLQCISPGTCNFALVDAGPNLVVLPVGSFLHPHTQRTHSAHTQHTHTLLFIALAAYLLLARKREGKRQRETAKGIPFQVLFKLL